VPPPTSITVPAPSMLSTRSAKSRGNETRATTVATAATAAGSVRRWPNVRMLGDIVPLAHSVPSPTSSGVQQPQYRNIRWTLSGIWCAGMI
jgi:hypothetical protein